MAFRRRQERIVLSSDSEDLGSNSDCWSASTPKRNLARQSNLSSTKWLSRRRSERSVPPTEGSPTRIVIDSDSDENMEEAQQGSLETSATGTKELAIDQDLPLHLRAQPFGNKGTVDSSGRSRLHQQTESSAGPKERLWFDHIAVVAQ
ncbi:MAG: hypothetical protein M1836_000293 [Candelina mexicana]|nr:MAG: hypothetical protein M1836_000293 [Candelina mexicana]